MRHATIATIAVSALVLGGCSTHRQSHLQFPTIQDRDWWMVTATPNHTLTLASSDQIGSDTIPFDGYEGRSMLAVGDALGSASFIDTFAYAQAARQHRQDQLATVSTTD